MFSVEVPCSNPADDDADGQHEKDHQRPGDGYFPEQQLDIHHGRILQNESHNQKYQRQPDVCLDVHNQLSMNKSVNDMPEFILVKMSLCFSLSYSIIKNDEGCVVIS